MWIDLGGVELWQGGKRSKKGIAGTWSSTELYGRVSVSGKIFTNMTTLACSIQGASAYSITLAEINREGHIQERTRTH
jgi:hypothetical protein